MTSKRNSDSHESGSDPPYSDMSILDELFPSLGNGDSSSSHFTSQLALLLNTLNSSDDENGPSLFNPLQLSPPRLYEIHALAAASLVSQTQEAIMQEYNITEFDLHKYDVTEIETICSDETEDSKEQMLSVNQENKGHNSESNASFASGHVGHCLLSKSTEVEDSDISTDECKNECAEKGNLNSSLNPSLPNSHDLMPNLLLTSALMVSDFNHRSNISHEDLPDLPKVQNLCDTSGRVSSNLCDISGRVSSNLLDTSGHVSSNLCDTSGRVSSNLCDTLGRVSSNLCDTSGRVSSTLCDTSGRVFSKCSDASTQKSNSNFMPSSNLTLNLSIQSCTCSIKQTDEGHVSSQACSQHNHRENPRSDGSMLNNNSCQISHTKTCHDGVNETQKIELNSKKRKLEFEDVTLSTCDYYKNCEKLNGRSSLTSIKETCDKKLKCEQSHNIKDGDNKHDEIKQHDINKTIDETTIHNHPKQKSATSRPHSAAESILDDGVVFACHLCAAVFGCMADLEEHASSHHLYPCPHPSCGRTFTYRSHLSYHLHTHTGEKSFQCVECGKLFTKAQHLDVHMRSHQTEKMFKCKDCDKSFHTAGNLKNHARIHSGDKPYTCDINGCNRSFAELSSLKKHKVTHTGERSYRCDVCGKCFTQAGSRSYHMKKHADGTQDSKKKHLKNDGMT